MNFNLESLHMSFKIFELRLKCKKKKKNSPSIKILLSKTSFFDIENTNSSQSNFSSINFKNTKIIYFTLN